jgi:hypothetical protein
MDGIRIVLVFVEKLEHLLGVVITGFDVGLFPFMLRFGYQQHGVFWHVAVSLGCSRLHKCIR